MIPVLAGTIADAAAQERENLPPSWKDLASETSQ